MNCCLWLNGIKIRRADEIKNNFDPSALRGYLWGGSLVRWLYQNGGRKAARLLENFGDGFDINQALEYAFGLRKSCPEKIRPTFLLPAGVTHKVSYANSFVTSLHGFGSSVFPLPRYYGSYNIGSFIQNVSAYVYGSYKIGSFILNANVYRPYNTSSFIQNANVYRSYLQGLYNNSFMAGSFDGLIDSYAENTLNRYGYGIHII